MKQIKWMIAKQFIFSAPPGDHIHYRKEDDDNLEQDTMAIYSVR